MTETNRYLRASDVISGQEGYATVKVAGIPGVRDGIHTLFMVKSLEATAAKNKQEVRTISNRATQSKTTGWKGTGSMTIFMVSSLFTKLVEYYAKTGIDTYFEMVVVNEDEGSTVGKQTITLLDCNIDSAVIAKLDVENTALDSSVDFTFEDFRTDDAFVEPSNSPSVI